MSASTSRLVRDLALDRVEPGRLDAALRGPRGARLVDACTHHGLVGHVHDALHGFDDLPDPVADRLEAVRARAVQTHLRALVDVTLLASLLDDLPWAVVKGPVLAEAVYGDFTHRPYNDLDVLVPPEAMAEALHRLERAGGRTVDRNWDVLHARVAGEVHVVLPGGSLCDLHWHLLHDARERSGFHLPTADQLARRTTVEVGGLPVPTLDPVDSLVHLAVHACLGGGDRVLWALDLRRLVARWDPDWSTLVARSRTAGTGLALAAMATVARPYGPVMPPDVHGQLDPDGTWTRLVTVVRALAPPERSDGAASPLRMVCRATRATTSASLCELRHRVRGFLAAPTRTRARARADRRLPTHRGAAVHPSGGEPARRAWLAAVQAAGSTTDGVTTSSTGGSSGD